MKLPNATATPSISDAVSGHPSAAHTVTRRSDGISSPPLPTPLSWSPIDSTRNFGVKGNHRRDPPTACDRPFMQPAGNVTLSNYSQRMVLGSLAAGGALGNLIPPGITFIIYGL